MYYDIHTHSECSGVEALLDVPFEKREEGARLFGDVKRSLSLHPLTPVEDDWTVVMQSFREELIAGAYIAIGEVGLDKRSVLTYAEQRVRMEAFVKLSEELHLPLIVHCVGLYNELLSLHQRMNPTQLWIIHGFRGNLIVTQQLLRAANVAFSFGRLYNEQSLQSVPIERLWLETDEAPSIAEVYDHVAKSRGMELEELKKRMEINWNNLLYR